jgi:hypothetical protein
METITRSGLLWDCWIMAIGLDFSYTTMHLVNLLSLIQRWLHDETQGPR